jgi:hypothetical protein
MSECCFRCRVYRAYILQPIMEFGEMQCAARRWAASRRASAWLPASSHALWHAVR